VLKFFAFRAARGLLRCPHVWLAVVARSVLVLAARRSSPAVVHRFMFSLAGF